MRWTLLVLTVFFFQHSLRDYLQMHNIWNIFTEFGHEWQAPQYEKYSLAISFLLGCVFLVFYLRTFHRHVKRRLTHTKAYSR